MTVQELIERKKKIGAVGSLDFLIEYEKKRAGKQKPPLASSPEHSKEQPSALPGRDALFRDYLRRAESKKDSFALDATILRNDSVNGRELLAWRASHGRLDEKAIRGLAEAARAESFRKSARESIRTMLDPEWALRLARIMLVQRARPDDVQTGLTLLDCLYKEAGSAKIIKKFGQIFFDATFDQGEIFLAKALVDNKLINSKNIRNANIDLFNPFCGSFNDPNWLDMFNTLFTEHDLDPLYISNTVIGEPFDRIYCDVSSGVINGPLVTVIVTSYNPDHKLVTSVQSILEQSYRNIEVLIIDDASTKPESQGYLDICKQLDPRVSVHVQPINNGTYIARNRGLSLASGEFITGQDSDDWSHPRRIELQIQPLLQDTELYATQSYGIKCFSNFKLSHYGRAFFAENVSSILFRRKPVLDLLGGYDTVRKGADNEFIFRLSACFGTEVLKIIKPLALIRLTPGGLSREDFRPGWRHPNRRSYRRSYDYWHELIRAKKSTAAVSLTKKERTFPAPIAFLPDKQIFNNRQYDVVFAGDWVSYGGPQLSMIEEIRSLNTIGLKIAVCDIEAFWFMKTTAIKPLCSEINKKLHEKIVDEVLLTEPISVRLLIIRYPPILQFTQREAACWQVEKAVLIANQPPCEADGSDLRYLTAECTDNAKYLFGVEPLWVPQGPHARHAIETLVPPALLSAVDNPGIINPEQWAGSRVKGVQSSLRIGRYSRDNPVKFPETKELMLEIYPSSGYPVHILGGVKSVSALFGDEPVPDNWKLSPYGSIPTREFLDSIDVFLYFDNTIRIEAFGRSILEAMASGCVLILPKKFEEVFGAGPIYCDSNQVQHELEVLQEDRVYFRSRQELTRETLMRSFTYDSFSRWVQGLLESTEK